MLRGLLLRLLLRHVVADDTAAHRADDRVVLVVFTARPLGAPQTTPEATEVRAFAPDELPWDELAFWSTTAALRDHLG